MDPEKTQISGHDPVSLIDLALQESAESDEMASLEIPGIEILALIGRGGMGEVYRARQLSLDREVAVKVLSPELSDSQIFAARFQTEAHALARLNHPHVVHVHEFGQTDEGSLYLVMELVEGSDLSVLLKANALPLDHRWRIAKQVAEGLAAAHEAGLIHRDVKPSNILVAAEGTVKLIDFGLTKVRERSDLSLTAPDTAMGTPLYMAPEQKEVTAEVDHRADLFSFGMVLYELITGRRAEGAFPPPSEVVREVPAALDRIVARALQADPEDRYPDMPTLLADLESVSMGWTTRSRRTAIRLLVGTPVLAALAGGAWWGGHTIRGHRPLNPPAGRLQVHRLFPEEPLAGVGLVPDDLGPVRDFAMSRAWEGRYEDRWSDSPGVGIAVKVDGSIRAWGADLPLVSEAPTGSGFVAVDSVFRHAIALREDGTVAIWGEGGGVDQAGPGEVGDAIQVAAGARASVVLHRDGTVSSWGTTDDASAREIGTLREIVQISARRQNGAALDANGGVRVWGANDGGQVEVPEDLPPAKQVEVGHSGVGALLVDGTVRIWGAGTFDSTTRRPGETFTRLCWLYCLGWVAKSERTGRWTLLAWWDLAGGSVAEGEALLESVPLDQCGQLVSTSRLFLAGIEHPES